MKNKENMMNNNLTMSVITIEKFKTPNIYFNEKPSEEIREELKREGWKYAKSGNCWYPTEKALNNAVNFIENLKEKYSLAEPEYELINNDDEKQEIMQMIGDDLPLIDVIKKMTSFYGMDAVSTAFESLKFTKENPVKVLASEAELVQNFDGTIPEKGLFLIHDKNNPESPFTAIDNSDGNGWTEDFKSLNKALLYLSNSEISAEEINSLSEQESKEQVEIFYSTSEILKIIAETTPGFEISKNKKENKNKTENKIDFKSSGDPDLDLNRLFEIAYKKDFEKEKRPCFEEITDELYKNNPDVSDKVNSFIKKAASKTEAQLKKSMDTFITKMFDEIQDYTADRYENENKPYVIINYSENQNFIEGKVFSLDDFNKLLIEEDHKLHEKNEGYDKLSFEIQNLRPANDEMNDFIEYEPVRYDIGDGNGSVYDFIRCTSTHPEIISAIDQYEINTLFEDLSFNKQNLIQKSFDELESFFNTKKEKIYEEMSSAYEEKRKLHKQIIIEEQEEKNIEKRLNDCLVLIKNTYSSAITDVYRNCLSNDQDIFSEPSARDFFINEAKKFMLVNLSEPFKNFLNDTSVDIDMFREINRMFPDNSNMKNYIEPILNETDEKLKEIKNKIENTSEMKINSECIKIVCYGTPTLWKNREDAINYYADGLTFSEGSERERYANIVSDLRNTDSKFIQDCDDYDIDWISEKKCDELIKKNNTKIIIGLDEKGEKIFSENSILSDKNISESSELSETASSKNLEIYSFSPYGYEGLITLIETDLRKGIPSYDIVGLAEGSVRGTREKIRAALNNSGFSLPNERILQSLSPADIYKDGTIFELAMALSILSENDDFKKKLAFSDKVMVLGELTLSGNILPVKAAHAAVETAKAAGITNIICSTVNAEKIKK